MKIEDFPFEYVGGGYFRDSNVPKGEKATIIHGDELIKVIEQWLSADTEQTFKTTLTSSDSLNV